MDIGCYPINILFTGNLYDIRGMEIYTKMNKARFHRGSFTDNIKLSQDEIDLILTKKDDKYYFKYSFINFLTDCIGYNIEFNSIDNISNPIKKEILYYFFIYPEIYSETKSLYQEIIKQNLPIENEDIYLENNFLDKGFNLNLVYLKNPRNIIVQLIWSIDIEGEQIKGYYNKDGLPIEGDKNFLKELLKDIRDSYKPGTFDIKSKKPNFFNSGIFIDTVFKLSNKILDYYKLNNFISIESNESLDLLGDHEIKYFLNEYEGILTLFQDEEDTKYIDKSTAYMIGEFIQVTSDKYYIQIHHSIDLNKLQDILKSFENEAFSLENFESLENIIQYIYNICEVKATYWTNYISSLCEVILNQIILKEKEIEDSKEIDIQEICVSIENIIKSLKLTPSKYTSFNKILMNINGKNYNCTDLKYVGNRIEFRCVNFKKQLLKNSFPIFTYLIFFKNDPNKCFNLNLNLDLNICSDVIADVLLENGYGEISKKFFRNDDIFKIYVLNYYIDNFYPDYHIILSLLYKIGFKKIKISIYKTAIYVIQSYENWKENQIIDKNLNNQSNLARTLKYWILYINVSIIALNPNLYDIESIIYNAQKETLSDPFTKSKFYERRRNLSDRISLTKEEKIKNFIYLLIKKYLYEDDGNYDIRKARNIQKAILLKGGSINNDKYKITKIYNNFKEITSEPEHKNKVKFLKEKTKFIQLINNF